MPTKTNDTGLRISPGKASSLRREIARYLVASSRLTRDLSRMLETRRTHDSDRAAEEDRGS